MLFFALICSVMGLVVVNGMARIPKCGLPLAFVASGAAAIVGLSIGWAVLLANASLVCLAGGICLAVRAGPRGFLGSSVAATAVAYGILYHMANRDVQEWEALQEQFPMESMAGRLAYEDRARTVANPPKTKATHPESALEDQVARGHSYSGEIRARSLEHLHAGYVKQFIESEGFGVGRRIWRPRRSALELGMTNVSPIPLPDRGYDDYLAAPESGTVGVVPSSLAKQLEVMHEDGVVDFVHVDGFGYVRDRNHVAGFESHRFSQLPKSREKWSVVNLELVSLLKHQEPMAYVSNYLPRMDKLKNAACGRSTTSRPRR